MPWTVRERERKKGTSTKSEASSSAENYTASQLQLTNEFYVIFFSLSANEILFFFALPA